MDYPQITPRMKFGILFIRWCQVHGWDAMDYQGIQTWMRLRKRDFKKTFQNIGILISGRGTQEFGVHATTIIPDLHAAGGTSHFFPRFSFRKISEEETKQDGLWG